MQTRFNQRILIILLLASSGCSSAEPAKSKNRFAKSKPATKAVASTSQEPADEVPESTPLPPSNTESTQPAPVFRPDDQRPKFDDATLAAIGIHRYESKRLRLYTDIPADAARPLPDVIDAAYDALSDDFGRLPPSRTGEEFQMTGYLMQDEKRFREAGMIPEDLPTIEHGRHRRNEFWLREQPYDYYRRHLLIHEVAHCVMMFLPENRAPVWYLEGMAELFGTHRKTADGSWQFGVMPTSPEEFAGFGRITLLQKAVGEHRGRTLQQVCDYAAEEYLTPEPYAWSWAACHFLSHHSRYSARFRELGRNQQPRAFAAVLQQLRLEGGRDLDTEWTLFIANIQYGFDISRAAITFQAGTAWTNHDPRTADVAANRGWQSTRSRVEANQRYEITATGHFAVAQQPKPWVSEADGISFRYVRGIPLGKLLACVREETSSENGFDDSILDVVALGSRVEFTPRVTGTLYLRVNDSWSELADNTGTVTVEIVPSQK